MGSWAPTPRYTIYRRKGDDDMAAEKQTTFGWPVAVDIFLGGAAAGVFLGSYVLDIVNRFEPIARVGAVVGPLLVLVGAFLLLMDLGTKTNFYRLFSNLSSWMSRGTCILTVFIICGLGYSLPSVRLFAWLPWGSSGAL